MLVAILTAFGLTGIDDEMTLFEAVAHAFATIPTGGFGTRLTSVAEFSAASQWAIALFMVLAGANFALMYMALARRNARVFARDEEFRLYLGVLALGSIVIGIELLAEGIATGEEGIRHAVFQAVSIMTTTGFATRTSRRGPCWPR